MANKNWSAFQCNRVHIYPNTVSPFSIHNYDYNYTKRERERECSSCVVIILRLYNMIILISHLSEFWHTSDSAVPPIAAHTLRKSAQYVRTWEFANKIKSRFVIRRCKQCEMRVLQKRNNEIRSVRRTHIFGPIHMRINRRECACCVVRMYVEQTKIFRTLWNIVFNTDTISAHDVQKKMTDMWYTGR